MGDKSELPLLPITPSLTPSFIDGVDAADTDTVNSAFESQLSELAISAVTGTDGDQEVNISTDVECEDVTSGMNQSESLTDTDAAAELDVEDGAVAASDSNYETSAEPGTQSDDVGSDAKGEVIPHVKHISSALIFSVYAHASLFLFSFFVITCLKPARNIFVVYNICFNEGSAKLCRF